MGEHASWECMCIVSPDVQENIDMVIVSTPVKRWCPLGIVILSSLPFLYRSCRVIGWLLRTWWTEPNVQGDVARPACVPAPRGTPDTYFSIYQGRGSIRGIKETNEKASKVGGVGGMKGPWWPKAVETNRSPTDALFCLLKKFIMIKEVLVGGDKSYVWCCSTVVQ